LLPYPTLLRSKVVVFLRHAEDQVVAKAIALQTNPGGIGNALQHSGEIAGFLRVSENFRIGHSSPPAIRSREVFGVASWPIRMNVTTQLARVSLPSRQA